MENNLSVNTSGEHKYYSAMQVFAASFLGGPFSGGLYLARTLRFLGRENAANIALKAGIGLTLGLGVVVVLPDWLPNTAIPAVYSALFSMQVTQAIKQSGLREDNFTAQKGSTLKLLGMSLCILAVTVVLWAAIFMVMYEMNALPESMMQEIRADESADSAEFE